jgi:predicted DNA-binding transcriptional regulator AlpA
MIHDESASALERVRVRVLPDGRMTREHAAMYLGLKSKTLAMWALQGKGPRPIHVGGRTFYRQAELDEFIQAGTGQRKG